MSLVLFVSGFRKLEIVPTFRKHRLIAILRHSYMGHTVAYLVEALSYKLKVRGIDSRWGHCFSSIYLIFPAALGPGVDSASNRNEYQKMFLGVKRGLRVKLTTLPPSVCRLPRKCVQPRHLATLWAFTDCYRDSFTLLYFTVFQCFDEYFFLWIPFYLQAV
jgi:hypothetical protein